ncbi:MAG: amidoligase family protein, partial [Oscillospiraceae bacterium]|nr:amidoligase family protein [Oscillospiraceae bacterium]
MKEQNFGVEIELTGVTREQAAGIIANYFGTRTRYLGTHYKTWGATDRKNRTWKAMSDASITTQRRENGRNVYANHDYSCEIV